MLKVIEGLRVPRGNLRNFASSKTISYNKLTTNTREIESEILQKLKNGERLDGRNLDEHRNIGLHLTDVPDAAGSSYVEYKDTKVICSIFYPREIPRRIGIEKGQINCRVKLAPFSTLERGVFYRTAIEKEYSAYVHSALNQIILLDHFPNLLLDVNIVILENAGSGLAAALMCVCLALCNANIPIYDIFVGITIGVYEDRVLVDPTYEEEEFCKNLMLKKRNKEDKTFQGLITLGYMPSLKQITFMKYHGQCSEKSELMKFINVAIEKCRLSCEILKRYLIELVEKELNQNEGDVEMN